VRLRAKRGAKHRRFITRCAVAWSPRATIEETTAWNCQTKAQLARGGGTRRPGRRGRALVVDCSNIDARARSRRQRPACHGRAGLCSTLNAVSGGCGFRSHLDSPRARSRMSAQFLRRRSCATDIPRQCASIDGVRRWHANAFRRIGGTIDDVARAARSRRISGDWRARADEVAALPVSAGWRLHLTRSFRKRITSACGRREEPLSTRIECSWRAARAAAVARAFGSFMRDERGAAMCGSAHRGRM